MTTRTLDIEPPGGLTDVHPARAVLAIRGELSATTTAEVEEWHLHEHILERISTPGFLRGRRCTNVSDGPGDVAYLVLYEAEGIEVFTSPEYVRRFDRPTILTQRLLKATMQRKRLVGRMTGGFGRGVGRHTVLIEFSQDGDPRLAFDDLTERILADLQEHREVVTARMFTGYDASDAAERQVRPSEAFLLVDLTTAVFFPELVQRIMAATALDPGANIVRALDYDLQFVFTDLDV